MRTAPRLLIAATLAGIGILAAGRDAATQQPAALAVTAGQADSVDALRQWDAAVDQMTRTGDLVVTSRVRDRSLEGRTHEYLAQSVAGVPVHGGGISRQLDGAGVTLSLFGTLHQGIDLDGAPALSGAEVGARLEQALGGDVVAGARPRLVVLPLPDGSYALAYRIAMSNGRFYFADAADGRILHAVDAFEEQSAIGAGADYNGDRRKLSTTQEGSRFEAHDRIRPSEIATLDTRFNFLRYYRLIHDHQLEDMPFREPIWTSDDIAADADNDWEDPAVVEAHVHTGWTYDYLSAQHGWEGVDGANGRIVNIVNAGFANAVAWRPPFGPEGAGVYVYGRTDEATSEEPWTPLDIVAHELMHGVTHFSVSERTGFGLGTDWTVGRRLGPASFTDERTGQTYTCDTARFPGLVVTPQLVEIGLVPAWCVDGQFLLASSQGGAVNEAYSDIIGESVDFFHQDAGVSADYQVGGDREFGPLRSPADPTSDFYPDTYRHRYEFALTLDENGFWDYSGFVFVDGRFAYSYPFFFGYGGSHWNSLILSHAFYLAIEGGTHRSSGLTVEGVGGSNRADIERIFFRGMTELMPASPSLPLAAAVIRQSAADLAAGSVAQRAVEQALRAVGLGAGGGPIASAPDPTQ